jgi:hypothetical protein
MVKGQLADSAQEFEIAVKAIIREACKESNPEVVLYVALMVASSKHEHLDGTVLLFKGWGMIFINCLYKQEE